MSVLSRLGIAASILDFEAKRFFRALINVGTIAAAGANQAGATAITTNKVVVTASNGAKGVRLPVAELDMVIEVINSVSNQDLLVYPATGEVINAIAANGAFTQVGGARATYMCDAAKHWYVAAGNLTGTATSSSTAELDTLHSVTAGTGAASKAVVLDANGGVTIPGTVQLNGNDLSVTAAAGITGGTGTVCKSGVVKEGGLFITTFIIDLTGLGSSTTDGDIIGQGASAAHIGRITAAVNGTIAAGRMTCLEAPATGVTDIDLFSATEATGKFDDAITGLTETSLVSSGGAWSAGTIKEIDTVAANGYLYLVNGAGGTVGTYTAGKFKIELYGY